MDRKQRGKKTAGAPATFESAITPLVRSAVDWLYQLKGRQSGAHTYGPDGLFVAALETLHQARLNSGVVEYTRAAAYALAAAIHLSSAWDLPLASSQSSEEGEPT